MGEVPLYTTLHFRGTSWIGSRPILRAYSWPSYGASRGGARLRMGEVPVSLCLSLSLCLFVSVALSLSLSLCLCLCLSLPLSLSLSLSLSGGAGAGVSRRISRPPCPAAAPAARESSLVATYWSESNTPSRCFSGLALRCTCTPSHNQELHSGETKSFKSSERIQILAEKSIQFLTR